MKKDWRAKVGVYFYELRGREFWIYQTQDVTADNSLRARFTGIRFCSAEDAKRKVKELNKW